MTQNRVCEPVCQLDEGCGGKMGVLVLSFIRPVSDRESLVFVVLA